MLLNCGIGRDSWESKETQPVYPTGNQPWIFIRRTDAEAEAPMLRPPGVKSQFIRKDPDAGKDWGQEKKEAIDDEMVGWHHRLNGHEFEQTVGNSEGQGSLACCSPWGCKESDTLRDWTTTKPFNSTSLTSQYTVWIASKLAYLLSSIFPSISVFSNESALCIQ